MLMQGINAVLNINVQTVPEAPYNLEDATLSMIIEKPDSKTVETIPGEIINALEGRARILLTPENLSEGGSYKYQVNILFPDNTVSKSAVSAFYVADSLQQVTV